MPDDDVSALTRRLTELEAENARLRELLGLDRGDRAEAVVAWEPTLFVEEEEASLPPVSARSSRHDKVQLFRSLFAGRPDVFAQRWENSRTGKSGWSPAVRGGWAQAKRPDREYLPIDDEVISAHLAGVLHAGVYPLMGGDTCRLLACDFDGPGWTLDALAYFDAARASGIPVGLERSRSGAGGHVWTFFSGPVPASVARRIGVYLLREAMTARAELGLASYDRLFPSQDFVPKGSFGNLIALPLHGESRKRGTTVFLDPATLEPHLDQWAYLSTLRRVSPAAAASLAEGAALLDLGPDGVSYRSHRRASPAPPPIIRANSSAMLSIDRIGLPPALVASLKHLASYRTRSSTRRRRCASRRGMFPG